MSESKVFMFPEMTSGNSGIDPNLMALLNQNGGFGGNNWMWIFFLWFLWPLMRGNGMYGQDGTGFLSSQLNNTAGRELVMQAIQGNGDAIRSLSTNLNCDINAIKTAINGVQTSIQGVGNQVGMSAMQIINSVQAGNTALGQQIAECCCENRLAICQQTNAISNSIESAADRLRGTTDSGFSAVLSKLDAIQNQNLLDKIDQLREEKSALTTQINIGNQNAYNASLIQSTVAPIAAQLSALNTEVAGIKCHLPSTTTIPYSPVTAVPNCVAYGLGLYGGNNGGFWF